MSKKQSPQQLSPENYIIKKSRTLSLADCLINDDWEEARFCNILISRQHTNGNYSVCSYLVDLFLLGVKDTVYFFNMAPDKYNELIEYNYKGAELSIPYEVAHNIIYSGVDFAEDFGFKAHKDFTKITQFFLEEDDDNIPMIEIECGYEGKPHFTNGPYDSPQKIAQIISQLELNAGAGNFTVEILNSDDFEDDDEFIDEIEPSESEWDEAEEVK